MPSIYRKRITATSNDWRGWGDAIVRDLERHLETPQFKTRIRAGLNPAVRQAKTIAGGRADTGRFSRGIKPFVETIKKGQDKGRLAQGLRSPVYTYAEGRRVSERHPPAHKGGKKVRWGQALGIEYGNRRYRPALAPMRKGMEGGRDAVLANLRGEISRELNSRRDRITIRT